ASTAAQSGEKTEAAIKKEYRSSHDVSVSSEQHKSSAVGGISINYTPFVTQDVLDSNFGGNPYAMLEVAQKNPKAMAAAAEEAGKRWLPLSSSPTDRMC
ncbi:MAG: hypothetical protein LBU76_09025, partial [Azoarcus sp.]|nr:hypothetical protein [Azoarcus sp.]